MYKVLTEVFQNYAKFLFMANLLDEKTGPVNEAGRDVNVIDKQLPATIGTGSLIFEICLWVVPIAAVLIPW